MRKDKEMKLAEVLQNPHFRGLAAFLRIPLCFREWYLAHPQDTGDTSINILVKNVTERLNSSNFTNDRERASFLLHFCKLIAAVINLDPRLQCKSGDIYWLMEVLAEDSCDALAIISMLFAYASTPLELLRLMACRVLHAMGVIEDVVNMNDDVNINIEEQLQALADALGVSIDEDTIQIPESLRQFAEQEHLIPTDVRMLARISYRGKQPDTVAKWQLLYLAIRTTTKY